MKNEVKLKTPHQARAEANFLLLEKYAQNLSDPLYRGLAEGVFGEDLDLMLALYLRHGQALIGLLAEVYAQQLLAGGR